MRVTTKVETTDYEIVIPKGTVGTVIGVQWGDKDGFVVDFPQHSRVFVKREDVVVTEEKHALQKPLTAKEEREGNKQTRQEEL